jgi:hypothetical protein
LMVVTFTFGSSRCTWCFLSIGFGGLLMVVQQFLMMKVKWWIIMKRQPRHLHYFVNISQMHNLHTFNIAKMSKTLGCARLLEISYFFEGGSSPFKCKKGNTCLRTSTWWKALVGQLRSIEMKIKVEDVYMVFFTSLPPSFNNLVTSLESMSTKMLTFNSSSFNYFMRFQKRKKVKVRKMSHCLTKLVRQTLG